MTYEYKIPCIPPSLNQFAGRENKWEYRQTKAEWLQIASAYCRPRPAKPFEKAVVTLEYHFPDARRRDPDNYIKLLMDGLVAAQIIKDDCFDCIELRLKQGEVNKDRPHVIVTVEGETA
jgi:Holliday junction resolvase RusA-like endonuclease